MTNPDTSTSTQERWQERQTWLHNLGITSEMIHKYGIGWDYYSRVGDLVWLIRAKDVIRYSSKMGKGRRDAKVKRRINNATG